MAGLVLVSTGCLIGCSGEDTQQNSQLPASTSLTLQPVTTSLTFPVFMTAAPNDDARLFIVEQGGRIRIFDRISSSLRPTAFLNLSGLISTGGERGLLGMAFDPNYTANGRLYVFYTNVNGDLVIAQYVRNAVDEDLANPASAVILLTITRNPNFSNHNGGMLAFGPDGCLYAGIGDGGGVGDPNNNGQSLSSLLGKLLRLNPDTGAPCNNVIINPFPFVGAQQVWSLGLRNPWRFSFDRLTDDLYIGDVGQSAREEIDVAVAPNAGRQANYGWRLMEGSLCFNPSSNCNSGGLTLPVLDYPHVGSSCSGSVTGGYVYRGQAMPSLSGTYFYADFCLRFVESFRFQNGQATEQTEWPLLNPSGSSITSFGEDALGELYLMTQGGGLFKIVPN